MKPNSNPPLGGGSTHHFGKIHRNTAEIKKIHNLSTTYEYCWISVLLKIIRIQSDYCPISLINSDIKIISKVLVNRMESIIAHQVHPDQKGFINGKHSPNNKHRLFIRMSISKRNKLNTVMASLDAKKKASDRFNWNFFAILKKFGFEESLIQICITPYSLMVLLHNVFTLHCGTRQGCHSTLSSMFTARQATASAKTITLSEYRP